jgi:tRNA pseudouridine(55) synthase
MIFLYKNRGETPLQALVRLRIEQPELAVETLSYAGRLDPMAEGIIPVLVGKEENQNRQDFLKKDKEYEAQFLIGCATDTFDVLGLITKSDFKKIEEEKIYSALNSLVEITEQVYPWYSSKTVDGIPLFEYARKGNLNIDRPSRSIKIYSVSDIKVLEVNTKDLITQNILDIQKVEGDFRQSESADSWNMLLDKIPDNVQIMSCVLKVSSGTYIRSLTENLEKELDVPVVLQKLVRTKVF